MMLDLEAFNFINGLAGQWRWLDLAGIFFAKYLEYVLLFCLLLFLTKDFKKYWRMVLEALVAAVFVRFVLAEMIRAIYFRQRPFVTNQVNLLVVPNPGEASFPSGHASFYFTLSTIIYGYNKKAGILFYIASFLIIISRVFVGIHWPSDVIAGALLGIAIGWILSKLFKKIVIKKSQ